jgi:general secretion pathway protein D
MRTIKRFPVVAVAALAGWLGTSNETCAAAALSVNAPSSVAVGDIFTVNADIASITDLYAFQFDLSFDPAVLAATSSTEGPFLPSGGATFFIPGAIDNLNGMVTATVDTLIAASGHLGSGHACVVRVFRHRRRPEHADILECHSA